MQAANIDAINWHNVVNVVRNPCLPRYMICFPINGHNLLMVAERWRGTTPFRSLLRNDGAGDVPIGFLVLAVVSVNLVSVGLPISSLSSQNLRPVSLLGCSLE